MPRPLPRKDDSLAAIVSSEEAARLQERYGARVVVHGGGPGQDWWDWQKRVLTCLADEVAMLGGKGSGKSAVMRGWLISGNPNLPDYDSEDNPVPVNQSYTYHPEYLGLILRKNEGDLADFIRRAARMWQPYGGEYKNGRFEFPSGARIDCGHLKDETSWQKYIGIEYQRIAIDEAGLIKEYDLFDELRSCMRTPYPELRVQIVLASNAGGPGTGWLIERYMKARDKNNVIIPHDTIIEEEFMHPFTGEKKTRTRIWMFSTVEDNPIYKTSDYAVTLLSIQDPKKRRAYFEGHWDALFGSYFGDIFRPEGPVMANSEPPTANHVIEPIKLQPWWHRSISMDWGYAHESAVLWAAKSPDRRTYIYRELVASQTSPVRMGFEIAMATREELATYPSRSITLHLSHDAFAARGGDKSYAELIAQGMARVLGANSVHLPDLLIRNLRESFAMNEVAAPWVTQEREKAIEAIRLQRRIGITIRIAEKTSVIGWQHCREIMRWESIGEINAQFDPQMAQDLLMRDPSAFTEYCKLYRDVQPEVLPKLQIFNTCKRLIDAIPRAQHEDGTEAVSKDHYPGRDSLDAFSYLVTGMIEECPPEPYEVFRDSRLDKIVKQSPQVTVNDLIHANRVIEAEWKDKMSQRASYTPPRHARASRMLLQGKMKPDQTVRTRVN